jgi:hypothetical protein
MPHAAQIELVLSARRVDVHDQSNLAAACATHAIAEGKMRAMLDVFGPLTDSLEVYVTR